MPELSDDTKRLLKQVIDHFDDEDRAVRDRQIKQWRRLKLLWENIQHTYYSEVAHDWRIPPDDRMTGDSDQASYDKPINVYRAYLESIIAALSVTVPPIICYPDDADNPLDVTTAKAGDKIAELVFRHNDVPLLWIHGLFVYMTEGLTAMYTYAKEDEEYGTYEEKQYEEITEEYQQPMCPMCNAPMGDKTKIGIDEIFDPSTEDILRDVLEQQMEICPNCMEQVAPQMDRTTTQVTRLVGVTKHPKSRICMEVMGGLYVKVPVWARSQKDCPYLIYSYETHYANVLSQYPELRDKILRRGGGATGSYEQYEQWGRISPQYHGEYPIHNVTVRNCWLRPCAFNVLNDEDYEDLKEQFPLGVKAVVVNDQVVEAITENLDDHWTLTYNPLSDSIHHDPIGLLLVSVQDITNDLISLVLQTVEHGIPQTFADPKVLNFNAYRNSEVIPGGIYPATPKSGRPLSEGFYEVRTATLSGEVLPFSEKIQQMGQMVSGALPSLFGGQMAGSRTASEYSMSRAQALQRLQTTWKMLTFWWKTVFGKVIPMYMKEMKDDEKQVKKDELGNFVNVFIRKSELEGKIGSIELEANENLPITWNQQKDTIMELFKMNNEAIMSTLMTPENMSYIKRAIGLTEYSVPGEDERQKEYEEIQQLVSSEPIEMPPDPMMVQQAMMMGQPPPEPTRVPSIEPDFDVDNHQMAEAIDKQWLISDAGRLCKLENPAGYENVLLHMKSHKDMGQMQMQEQMMQQMQMQQPPIPPEQAGQPMGDGQESQPVVQ